MSTALYSLASPLHSGLPDCASDPFITGIEAAMGGRFVIFGDDFSTYGAFPDSVIYVRTGGTEGLFRQLGLDGHVRLLASGGHNSLAAAMEILSYINMSGGSGEIIHGGAEYIASRLHGGTARIEPAGWIRPLPRMDLGGVRLGIIGRPSDWLISSDVDYRKAAEVLGATMVNIDIAELIADIRRHDCNLRSFEGSEAVYDSLRGIVAKYALDGLTVRCFDLLDTVGNTGCLGLARLNAEGVPSSCEGDIPALLTMMTAFRLTGCPGFQCNLSRISGDELLFAHCTVPLSMVRKYEYDTHFESGIGTAIRGELPEGEVTIFKIAPDLERMVAIHGRLVGNLSESCLCRTQVVIDAPGAAGYFLSSPLANHHVIAPGRLF